MVCGFSQFFSTGDVFLEWCKQYGNIYNLGRHVVSAVADSFVEIVTLEPEHVKVMSYFAGYERVSLTLSFSGNACNTIYS